jgi:hypothetical protein
VSNGDYASAVLGKSPFGLREWSFQPETPVGTSTASAYDFFGFLAATAKKIPRTEHHS